MENEITWIQCSNSSCGKWRVVSKEVAAKYEYLTWFCEMNTDDVKYSSCSVPEQENTAPKGQKIVFTKFPYKNGEVIMAKMAGYCL